MRCLILRSIFPPKNIEEGWDLFKWSPRETKKRWLILNSGPIRVYHSKICLYGRDTYTCLHRFKDSSQVCKVLSGGQIIFIVSRSLWVKKRLIFLLRREGIFRCGSLNASLVSMANSRTRTCVLRWCH